jgi:hypothetical protein
MARRKANDNLLWHFVSSDKVSPKVSPCKSATMND